MSDAGGIVLKGDDGSLYFIRDEILAAAKLEGEYLEAATPIIEAAEPEVEGFGLNIRGGSFAPVGNFNAPGGIAPGGFGKLGNPGADLAGKISSGGTIMCPW